MAQLRLLLIVSLAWFAFIFNAQQIVVPGIPALSLDIAVYALMLLTAVTFFSFPNLAKQNVIISYLVLIALYFVSLGTRRMPAVEHTLYDTAIDAVVIFVNLVLLRRLSHALLEFEFAVQAFVIDVKNARLISRMEGEEQVNQELYRARRFERPVAVAYCTVPANNGNNGLVKTDFIRWRITQTLRQRYAQVKIAQAAASLTYKSDCIIEHGTDVVVCLPETNRQEAETFARRLTRFAHELGDLEPLVGIATFPQEGLVFEDLIAAAQKKVRVWSDEDDDSNTRNGDVIIDLEQRLKIERDAEWVNKLAFQSQGARAIYGAIKRVVDVAACIIIAPLMIPVMLGIVLAIKLDDGGPIFYMQGRTGHGGHRFKMFKFRTMVVNAKPIPPTLVVLPNGKKQYSWPDKSKHDPRITRVGRFLRKSSLDEIPQILNVLKGDMSIVGPRPTTWELDKYTLHQTERLTVRPGITGLWQVSARESTNFDERLIWDMKYIQKMSLLLDVQIIWRTVTSVLQKKGA
jgi:lipopolysaccharide/colanic/teichoic acid biosynthesis glycosyltransferase